MSVRIEPGDMLEVIPRLVAEGVVCDACITDPPYHLGPTQKRFGATNSAPAKHGRDGAMARLSSGFMGQKWDGGDIAFRPETWATVATILRPGAFLLAFGGTRTYHRLVCAIEDAGFIVQDQIAWVFGSGFPKRRDMLKPAFEPLVLAYKPGGARTLQIDECRIDGAGNPTKEWRGRGARSRDQYRTGTSGRPIPTDLGRWPANLIHDGSDEVLELFPYRKCGDGAVIQESGADRNGNRSAAYGAESRPAGTVTPTYGDEGSAARFFYCAKADAQDRWGSRHPTVKPVELVRYLVKLACPAGGLFVDPFAGSGTAGTAALAEDRNAILIEREPAYIADINERMAWCRGEGRGTLDQQITRHREQKPPGGLFGRLA